MPIILAGEGWHEAPRTHHLFAGDDYYPAGGVEDYRGSFHSLEAAQAEGNKPGDFHQKYAYDWAHIAVWDGQKLQMVSDLKYEKHRASGFVRVWRPVEAPKDDNTAR